MRHLIHLTVLVKVALGVVLRNLGGRVRVLVIGRVIMKPGLRASVLCACLAGAGRAWATTLPDSRGDEKVKPTVKTEVGQPLPPEPGQVYYFSGEIVASRDTLNFDFSQLNEDEGKYQVKPLKLSTPKPNG
jgi:hypothetical protein